MSATVFASPALRSRPLPDESGELRLDGTRYQVATVQRPALRVKVAMPAVSAERLHRSVDLMILALVASGLVLAGGVAHALAKRIRCADCRRRSGGRTCSFRH
jgi:hypothetical protein